MRLESLSFKSHREPSGTVSSSESEQGVCYGYTI